jgi:hypothetical protein
VEQHDNVSVLFSVFCCFHACSDRFLFPTSDPQPRPCVIHTDHFLPPLFTYRKQKRRKGSINNRRYHQNNIELFYTRNQESDGSYYESDGGYQ